MIRHLLYLTVLLATAAPASAQYAYPYQSPNGQQPSPPVLSPYLNLRSGTNNAGVNYYNFVRPQLQLQQQQLYAGSTYNPAFEPYPLASDINVQPDSRIPRASGQNVTFMNTGPYFNSLGTIGGAARPGQQGMASNAGRSPVAGAPSPATRR